MWWALVLWLQVARKLVIIESDLERTEERAELSERLQLPSFLPSSVLGDNIKLHSEITFILLVSHTATQQQMLRAWGGAQNSAEQPEVSGGSGREGRMADQEDELKLLT